MPRLQSPWLITVLSLAALVLLLWLPFGFKTTGLMEEWIFTNDLEKGTTSERSEEAELLILTGTLRLRPLTAVPFIAAYHLTPDSYLGYNLVMMLSFFSKGLLLYAILRKLLPEDRAYAALAALLLVIFPSDNGLFTFRAINIHTAVVCYLSAVYLLLDHWQRPHPLKMVGAWAFLLFGLLTYELVYPLVLVTPALLLLLEARPSRRMVRVAGLWWVAPVASLLYVGLSFPRGDTYQGWVLQRSGINRPEVVLEMAESVYLAYRRHFFDGWLTAIGQIGTSGVLFPALAVVGGGIAALAVRAQAGVMARTRRYIILFLIGLVVIGLGYILFLITPYRQLDWRVYYYSSIGGALCTASLVRLVSRQSYTRFTALSAVLLALATLWALNQHQYYVSLSQLQQRLLAGVVREVPRLNDGVLVVVDETGQHQSNWTIGTSYLLEYTLQILYEDYGLQAVLCSYAPGEGFVVLPELREQCAFTDEGIVAGEEGRTDVTYAYHEAAVIRYTEAGAELLTELPYLSATLPQYNPLGLVDTGAPLPRRYFTMFSIDTR